MSKFAIYILAILSLTGCQQGQKPVDRPADKTSEAVVKGDTTDSAKDLQNDSVVAFKTVTKTSLENSQTIHKRFDGKGNDTLTLGSARLCVPAEGMTKEMVLSITPLDSAQLPKLPAGMKNVTTKGGGYRFLPHGEHFKRYAKVVLPYDSVRIPKGYTTKDIRTYYYDEQSGQWVVLPKDSINKEEQLASALTTHFTDMINGIITVPETPEAQGFAPTAMTDIKAADPSAGIMPVQAPSPNNNGTANIQIPFNFPAGRAGMGPEISVGYSSEGGSSWCGYGWSLSVPSISVETRWGVPLYSKSYETESYLLNGEQFTDRHYRKWYLPRSVDKRFYLRRESDFATIIRKGDSPTNYTWMVYRSDGSKEFYIAIEKDAHGNIAKWGLSRKEDIHGNCVTYGYSDYKETGVAYVESVNFTGNGEEKGVYTLKISRKSGRKDATTTGRNGFLQKDQDLLDKIEVYLHDKVIRQYQFEYKDGRFSKALLLSVAESNGNGEILYKNEFEYYDDIEANDNKLFSSVRNEAKTSVHYGENCFFPDYNKKYSSKLSNVGGATSSGTGINTGANISFGFSAASVYGGSSYIHNRNNSEAQISMVDIDGDGLPDKVFREGGKLFYYKNTFAETGILSFGEKKDIVGIYQITGTNSTSNGFGSDVGVGYGWLSTGCSYSYTKDVSKTKCYLQDFNGDGLVDFAKNGVVYFNRIKDGVPTFVSTSDGTPNPIEGTDTQILNNLIAIDTIQLRDSLEREYPLQDAVRSWRAPFSGKIAIQSPVMKSSPSNDGVTCTVQHNGKELKRWKLTEGSSYNYEDSLDIKRGDHLYFRLLSNYSGKDDQVEWAPIVTYKSFKDEELNSLAYDENGEDFRVFSASADYQQAPSAPLSVAGPAIIDIDGPYTVSYASESIDLVVVKTNKNDEEEDVFVKTIPAGVIESGNLAYHIEIGSQDTFLYSFRIRCKGVIARNSAKWSPIVKYTVNDTAVSEIVIPERNKYNNVAALRHPINIELDSADYATDTIYLSPRHNSFAVTVKESGGHALQVSDKLEIHKDSIDGKNLNFTLLYKSLTAIDGSEDLVDLIRKKEKLVEQYDTVSIAGIVIRIDTIRTIERYDTVVATIKANVYTEFDNADFGEQYRGWGQFVYNGNQEYASTPMDEGVLHSDDTDYSNVKASNLKDIAGQNKYSDQRFHTMLYSATGDSYKGGGDNIFISATSQSSSRLGQEEIDLELPDLPEGGGTGAPVTETKTETNSYTVSGGAQAAQASVGLNFSYSDATTLTENGVMDLNGDRYPDWTFRKGNGSRVAYTDVRGAVTSLEIEQIFRLQKQDGYSKSVGGSVGNATGEVMAITTPKKAFVTKNANDAGKAGESSFSASGNYGSGTSISDREWYDINGDGLPDMVFNDNSAMLNTGYGFVFTNDYKTDINKSDNSSYGAGLTVNKPLNGRASIGAGVNFTRNESENVLALIDVNGDGLPDRHEGSMIRINTGTGFSADQDLWNVGNTEKSVSVSRGMHINGGASIRVLFISITPYLSLSTNSSTSRTESTLMDIDGDGFPDYVSSTDDGELIYHKNMTGRTNLLKTVKTPFGSTINIDYQRTKNTYDMPNSKFVLSTVEIKGGNKENGATRQLMTFEYENGLYDRYEREFLGFEKVKSHQHDTENDDAVYRTITQVFGNKNFLCKGLLLSEVTTDNINDKLSEKINTYVSDTVQNGGVFQALSKTVSIEYTNGNPLTISEGFLYDKIGNITNYTSNAGDVVMVGITYHNNCSNKRIPASVEVKGGSVRKRSTKIDSNTGDITEIRMENGDKPSIFNFEYDQYGNITKVTRPANEQGDRFWNKLTYDDVLHSLVVGIENAYGYSSSSEYDYRFGVPTKTTDINGQSITYEFDNFGRMTKVKAPYEDDYTIKFSYNPSEKTAKTFHYTLEGDIVTTTTSDDLMRPIKVEKTAVVDGSLGTVATGIVTYDAFGRTVREALPTLNDGQTAGFSETRYDAHDRKVEVILPDGSSTKMAYEVVNNGLKTTVTDAEGHVSEQYTDARQRTVKTVRKGDSEDIIVEYEFNPLGELLTVTHPNQTQTKYTYDLLGNKLSVDNPDAGLTKFTYDAVGNLVTKQTPTLSKISNGGYIKYIYDFERLSEVQYPVYVTNRIQYTYGEHDDKNNCAGRIKLVQDASGGTEFTYGKLGEIIKTTRSVMLSTADVRTYVSESEYDSWNRIRKMKYPDGETVTYGYDAAGQLISMESEKDNIRYKLIEDMRYDQYGNVTYKKYGNGTESYYTYDPMRQRLATMTALSKGNAFMDAKYSYDKIDNILGIKNDVNQMRVLGGSYSHTYNYDAFSRLVSASGNCSKGVTYDLKMQYDIMSNPLRKTQKVTGSIVASSHDLEYTYGGSKPNAVQKVGNEAYTYDMNGNPTLIEGDTTYREMVWNEENRLMMLADEDYVSRYTYDYTGNRVIKSHGPMTTIYINGALQGVDFHDDENYTLYVSPFMTVNSDRFTKYYYAGTQRIASKIGSGKFDNVYGVNGFHLTAGQMDYAERAVEMIDGIKEFYKQSGVTPGVPNQLGQNANPYVSGVAYPSVPLGDYSVPAGWPGAVEKHGPGEVMGPPVWFKEEELPEAEAGVGFKSDYQRENDMFFFHTDHLGSTSYLTDTAGNVSQFVWYAPYGEALVDEHTAHYENPLKFSGKELDEITGLYDHGARNRNPISTLWYGIDPLFEKYPDFSPYNYCAGNPVRLVDPNGRAFHNFYPNSYQTIQIPIDILNIAEDCMFDRISSTQAIYAETDRNTFQQTAQLNNYENDNALHIAGHGIEEGQYFMMGELLIATSEQIKNLNTENYDIIVLHSCQTGKESDQYGIRKSSLSFANSISREMPDKYIVAPSQNILFSVDNTDDCEMFNPSESVVQNGTWNIWQNGKVIGKLNGATIPTSDVIKELIEKNGE